MTEEPVRVSRAVIAIATLAIVGVFVATAILAYVYGGSV